ncbi:MAG: hypothetical protein SFV24_25705 [Gemmatimonadales bacterium]|nr:hypothetical protein [Gemmatimonadales bacterium]
MRNHLLTTRAIRGTALLVAFALGGCGLLNVENPDNIPPEDVENPQGLPALHAGAIGDFSVAYGGDGPTGIEGQILVVGSFTDELGNSETFPTRKEYDQRAIDLKNGTLDGVFRTLQNARRSAEVAGDALTRLSATPTTDSRITETYALAGYSYVFMGENYCSGVPISNYNASGDLEFGAPKTSTQLFEAAVALFDKGLAVQGSATTANLAKVGKARALLNLGRFADAAAAVAGVPITFTYNTTHTTAINRQQNGIFSLLNQAERFSVAERDGGNGLNFRSAQDPRVPWARLPGTDVGFDNATPQYDQGKYANESAPIPVANGVEAELIAAEVALRNGDATTWLGKLNALRTNTALYPANFPAGFPAAFPALQPLTDPGTAADRVELMFRERAFWLYLTAHRLGDLRRRIKFYNGTTAVFPGSGGAAYVIDGNNKGGVFGTDVNLPVPFNETNNPSFTGCLDRNP